MSSSCSSTTGAQRCGVPVTVKSRVTWRSPMARSSRLFERVRKVRLREPRRAQIPDGLPRLADVFLDHPADLHHPPARRPGVGLVERVRQIVHLQRQAGEALQQRVVDRAAHADALGEHQRKLPPHAAHTQPPHRGHDEPRHRRHHRCEPARLVEHRLHAEVPGGARRPRAVAVGGLDHEAVLPRRQIRVDRLATAAGVEPVVIEPVEPIAEPDARGVGERERRERDVQVRGTRGREESRLWIELLRVGGHRLDAHRRHRRRRPHPIGIHDGEPAARHEPHPPVRRRVRRYRCPRQPGCPPRRLRR